MVLHSFLIVIFGLDSTFAQLAFELCPLHLILFALAPLRRHGLQDDLEFCVGFGQELDSIRTTFSQVRAPTVLQKVGESLCVNGHYVREDELDVRSRNGVFVEL